MRAGHAKSMQWSTIASPGSHPGSPKCLLTARTFAHKLQSRHQFWTGHDQKSNFHATRTRLGWQTLDAGLAPRSQTLRVSRAFALHVLSAKPYNHAQFGVARTWAERSPVRLHRKRALSSVASPPAAMMNRREDLGAHDGDSSISGDHKSKHKLPSDISEKLGVRRTILIRVRDHSAALEMLETLSERLYNRFVQNVRNSSRRGLSCWAEALLQCCHEFGDCKVIAYHSLQWARIPGAVWKGRQRTYWIWAKLEAGCPAIELGFSHDVGIQQSISQTAADARIITDIRVTLLGRIDERRLAQANPAEAISGRQEANFLADMAATVASRVCEAMKFQTVDDALSAIAETMLRVLEFRSHPLVLHRVGLIARNATSQTVTLVNATWKTSTSGVGNEVEVTFDHKSFVHNQDMSTEARDEDHEEPGDGFDIQADVNQASSGKREVSSDVTGHGALQSVDDSVTALAHDGNGLTLRPADFLPLQRSHLHVPLYQNQLVLERGDKKQLSFRKLSSKPIEIHLGVRNLKISLAWSPEQWKTVAKVTPLELAQDIEDHLVNKTKNSITSCSEAMNTLIANLPGNPSVRFEFTTHLDGYGGIGEAKVSFFQPHHDTIHLFLPGLSVNKPGRRLMVMVILRGNVVAQDSQNQSIQKALQSVVDSLEPFVRDIFKDAQTQDSQHAAQLIATRVLHEPRVSAGVLKVNRVDSTIVTQAPGESDSAVRASAARGANNEAIFVALGSNIGDRVTSIEDALRILDSNDKIRVLQTSPLYETEPMYVEDQERFLNGVCKIETELEPVELLNTLQAVESGLGRVKLIDKGPRNIDLDIVAYGQRIVETNRLIVPHRLMLEREFVLRPLCDLANDFNHPQSGTEVAAHLLRLPPADTPMYPLTPLAPGLDAHSLNPARKTMVMSILNVTPDSFSDGGIHQPTEVEALKTTVAAHIAAGAKIIDIGGQSSRPNAPDVSPEEEIARILPAIEAIKSLPEASKVAISIDTYRAAVAEAAINAGAHMINDISAGMLDPDMLSTIARLGCTYIMMHMRGTPATMQNDENTSYPDGLISTIASELTARLKAAEEAGIRRWRIILDPGIGFAKDTGQNLDILCKFRSLRYDERLRTYPWLVGSSRKGFIGKITGVENAADRVSGTAATVTAAVQGGAEIVRVHDVEEMVRVVKMADAMYRGLSTEKSVT